MQLSKLSEVETIAPKNNFSIFELPKTVSFNALFSKCVHVGFELNKDTGKMRREITKTQIDSIIELCHSKQTEAMIIVIEHADALNESAANTFLKSLEEPGEYIHYVFLTHNIDGILPTIRSRANCYYLAESERINEPPHAELEVFQLAKEYVSATPKTLPSVVEKILKLDKNDTRQAALKVVSCGIDIMYKSYLLRGSPSFLQKIEQLIAAQQAIDKNGHIKLQLIANML